MEKKIVFLMGKLEKRWFNKGDNAKYNEELKALLLGDEYVIQEDIDDIMWFFENVFVGDEFNKEDIAKDFKDGVEKEVDKYINLLFNLDEILIHVNGLGFEYN